VGSRLQLLERVVARAVDMRHAFVGPAVIGVMLARGSFIGAVDGRERRRLIGGKAEDRAPIPIGS